ncbi:hypothetical protein EVAR_28115_1 [Eumeta japonica]|uniref:Uncharacterized protein n=1 Tax=Eumeta variegata TaxID=151549 RepID=A0A4C1VFM7_EUMVA|nr:hypothetical protein EVAR_28115_1 [Eumeta japonica]
MTDKILNFTILRNDSPDGRYSLCDVSLPRRAPRGARGGGRRCRRPPTRYRCPAPARGVVIERQLPACKYNAGRNKTVALCDAFETLGPAVECEVLTLPPNYSPAVPATRRQPHGRPPALSKSTVVAASSAPARVSRYTRSPYEIIHRPLDTPLFRNSSSAPICVAFVARMSATFATGCIGVEGAPGRCGDGVSTARLWIHRSPTSFHRADKRYQF